MRNLIHEYLNYITDNPEHYWFKRKLYGWGWTPATKEGWAVTLIFVALVVAVLVRFDTEARSDAEVLTVLLPQVGVLLLLFITIAYAKGERPKWQWGPGDAAAAVQSYERVLSFWFDEASEEDWFSHNETFDETIRTRFATLHQSVARGECAAWRTTPRGALAEIVVLDQFSRNLFRGTKEMYAHDQTALARAEEAIQKGFDTELPPRMRMFLYLPFMHSESRKVHERALKLFTALGNGEALNYENLHKKIIDRFGHYPHRNAILGRETTAEEAAFLENDPHASF